MPTRTKKEGKRRDLTSPPRSAIQPARPRRLRPLPAEADETHSIEPDIFDGDLTPSDLAYMLEHLQFRNGARALSTIRIDRQVRDYLVRAIAPGRR